MFSRLYSFSVLAVFHLCLPFTYLRSIFFWLSTDWGSPVTRPTTDFPNKQSAPRRKVVSLRGKTTTQNSYSDLKIMGQKQRKVILTEVCSSALWRLLFKYSGIYFQTSLGHRSVRGLKRHKGQAPLRSRWSCHGEGCSNRPTANFSSQVGQQVDH